MLSFNFYFLPPFGTWHIADSTNWVAWTGFNKFFSQLVSWTFPGEETGGMMRYGIPAYRLPRDVLTGELEPDLVLQGVLEAGLVEEGFDEAEADEPHDCRDADGERRIGANQLERLRQEIVEHLFGVGRA